MCDKQPFTYPIIADHNQNNGQSSLRRNYNRNQHHGSNRAEQRETCREPSTERDDFDMNPEWLIQEKRRLRLVKKLIAVHLKGSACAVCGNRELEELEFHHPLKDRQYESGLTTLSFKQIFEEMHKVILLCAPCHTVLDDDRHNGSKS
jgi:hypothetical protein